MSTLSTKPIFILGATAAGKTALAIGLQKILPVDIISVDSALIYKKMDIGTAKPTDEELSLAPHSLINLIEPWERYSVSNFIEDAKVAIQSSQSRGRIPLLVGGTMMYFNALEKGLTDMPSATPELRLELDQKATAVGWQAMHDELALVDPVAANRIHPNDPQRIQRALEVWYSSGKSMTDWHRESSTSNAISAIKYGLFPQDRAILHMRIAERFELMIDLGFLREVEQLMAYDQIQADLPSMRCVGYRQAWNHLLGKDSFEQMHEKAKAATRQLAKRQITWMRKMQNLHLFDSCELSTTQIIEKILLDREQEEHV